MGAFVNLDKINYGRFSQVMNHYIGGYKAVVQNQAEELAIFQELEFFARTGHLTEELLQGIYTRLDEHREKARKIAEAAKAKGVQQDN